MRFLKNYATFEWAVTGAIFTVGTLVVTFVLALGIGMIALIIFLIKLIIAMIAGGI